MMNKQTLNYGCDKPIQTEPQAKPPLIDIMTYGILINNLRKIYTGLEAQPTNRSRSNPYMQMICFRNVEKMTQSNKTMVRDTLSQIKTIKKYDDTAQKANRKMKKRTKRISKRPIEPNLDRFQVYTFQILKQGLKNGRIAFQILLKNKYKSYYKWLHAESLRQLPEFGDS